MRNLSNEIFSSLRQLEYIENFAIRKKSVIYGIFVLCIIENPVQNLTYGLIMPGFAQFYWPTKFEMSSKRQPRKGSARTCNLRSVFCLDFEAYNIVTNFSSKRACFSSWYIVTYFVLPHIHIHILVILMSFLI